MSDEIKKEHKKKMIGILKQWLKIETPRDPKLYIKQLRLKMDTYDLLDDIITSE